jgi:hypothetical protein
MKKKILKFEIKIFNIEINKNIYFLNFLIKFTFITYIKLLYVFYKFNVIKIFSFIFKNNKC